MATTVYAMGKWTGSSFRFRESLSVVAKDAVGGGVTNYVTGYGPENLTDANQATFLRGYHGGGGETLQLIPTITYETLTGSSTTSLFQSVVLINVSSSDPSATDDLEPRVLFFDSGGSVVGNYVMDQYTRPNGAMDCTWSGSIPATAATALIQFATVGIGSTTYVQIGQMMASYYNQAYTWPCTGYNTIDFEDSILPERNIDQIQTIGGQRFDKFLFQRYIWSGSLKTVDQTFMGNLQWWQAQEGIYLQSGEWGYRAPYTTGLYGKLRLGSMTDTSNDTTTVYNVPFEFQENPA